MHVSDLALGYGDDSDIKQSTLPLYANVDFKGKLKDTTNSTGHVC